MSMNQTSERDLWAWTVLLAIVLATLDTMASPGVNFEVLYIGLVFLSLRPPDLYGFIFGRRLTRTRCGRWGFVTGMRGGGEVAAGNKSGTFDLGKKCPLSGVRTKVPCRNHYCR